MSCLIFYWPSCKYLKWLMTLCLIIHLFIQGLITPVKESRIGLIIRLCVENEDINTLYVTDYAGPRDYVVTDSNPRVASSVRVFCACNSQREGRNLPWQGRDHFSQWGMGISVGFFTETTSFLPKPGPRHTPSCLWGTLWEDMYYTNEASTLETILLLFEEIFWFGLILKPLLV